MPGGVANRRGGHALQVLDLHMPGEQRIAAQRGQPPFDIFFGDAAVNREAMFVSDFFDFSIYVDARETDIEQWYVERFLTLRETVFRNPSSYFHRYAALTTAEAIAKAHDIWRTINLVNLRENVLPTRERAHLILEKGRDHAVRRVRLRRL